MFLFRFLGATNKMFSWNKMRLFLTSRITFFNNHWLPPSCDYLNLGLPQSVPAQYTTLKECSTASIRARLRLLHHFSDMIYASWRLLNLNPKQVRVWRSMSFLSLTGNSTILELPILPNSAGSSLKTNKFFHVPMNKFHLPDFGNFILLVLNVVLNISLIVKDTGNCQTPVFSLDVSQHMHTITNLWKFELNRSSKLRDNNERNKHPCHTKLCASDAWFRDLKI